MIRNGPVLTATLPYSSVHPHQASEKLFAPNPQTCDCSEMMQIRGLFLNWKNTKNDKILLIFIGVLWFVYALYYIIVTANPCSLIRPYGYQFRVPLLPNTYSYAGREYKYIIIISYFSVFFCKAARKGPINLFVKQAYKILIKLWSSVVSTTRHHKTCALVILVINFIVIEVVPSTIFLLFITSKLRGFDSSTLYII